jgi:hypothetical protein
MPKREKRLHWDMSFDEALRRVAQTDPRELPVEEKKKRKRPLRAKKTAPAHSANDPPTQ